MAVESEFCIQNFHGDGPAHVFLFSYPDFVPVSVTLLQFRGRLSWEVVMKWHLLCDIRDLSTWTVLYKFSAVH